MNSSAATISEDTPDFVRHHRVRWVETDATGTVHFANFIRMMEETEYAFLRSRGLSVVAEDERGTIGFPRVSASLEIGSGARFGDELEIRLYVGDNDGVKIRYRFQIVRGAEAVATGAFTIACCRFSDRALPRAILIPDFFQDQFLRKDFLADGIEAGKETP